MPQNGHKLFCSGNIPDWSRCSSIHLASWRNVIAHVSDAAHITIDDNFEDAMQYIPEILSFIGGLGCGVVLKILIDNSKNSTKIRGNKVGGDLAGRDINKKG